MGNIITSPLVGGPVTRRDLRIRLALFLLWAALVAMFLSDHAFWRDEVRAFSLALSGDNLREMLANVQGEGHPALWYLILRSLHELFPYREVLPVAGAVIGVAAMAMVAFLSPFRTAIVAMILFSAFGAFEYVVVARNYGIAALFMVLIAALYPRIRNSLWFGLLIALLANTNVPACILAGCFLLFQFVKMVGERASSRRDWTIFAGNAALAAAGACLCFITVYPTVNDAAVSTNLSSIDLRQLGAGLLDTRLNFRGTGSGLVQILIVVGFLAFLRERAALVAAIAGFLLLKYFFYLVYISYYRHEALYVVFLIALHWIVARDRADNQDTPAMAFRVATVIGQWSFVLLLAVQSALLILPVVDAARGIPYSRSADVAGLLDASDLRGATVMADIDTMLEPLPYYVDNPLWLSRQGTLGHVVRLSKDSRRRLTLDDVVSDARRLHQRTGRPVVYLSHYDLESGETGKRIVLFGDELIISRDGLTRFHQSMRRIASVRDAGTDEYYDVYVYPR